MLRKGKEEDDERPGGVQGPRRKLKPLARGVEKGSGWRAVLGVGGQGMSKVERKTFWWEMLSQVSADVFAGYVKADIAATDLPYHDALTCWSDIDRVAACEVTGASLAVSLFASF